MSNCVAAPENAAKNGNSTKMKYFVLETLDGFHVVYQNHRNELISVSICDSPDIAAFHAIRLNESANKPKPQQSGNRYLRRYAGKK